MHATYSQAAVARRNIQAAVAFLNWLPARGRAHLGGVKGQTGNPSNEHAVALARRGIEGAATMVRSAQ